MVVMTHLLYMHSIKGNYIKEFDATVIKNKKDYVCLDRSVFYPVGGGQPSDVGVLQWDDNKSEVNEVVMKGDTVKHIFSGGTMLCSNCSSKKSRNSSSPMGERTLRLIIDFESESMSFLKKAQLFEKRMENGIEIDLE